MCLVCPPGFQLFVTVLLENVRLIFLQWLDFLTGRLAGMSKTTKINRNSTPKVLQACLNREEPYFEQVFVKILAVVQSFQVADELRTRHPFSDVLLMNENLVHFNVHRPHTPYLTRWPWWLCSLYKSYIKDILGVRTENQQTTVMTMIWAQMKLSEIIFKH